MKVKGLDKREYSLDFKNKEVIGEQTMGRSQYHLAARSLLRQMYSFVKIYEEITLPGCSTSLYVDFMIPIKRLAFEVQGSQHRKFNKFFHGNMDAFLAQRKRDAEKKIWAELNGFTLIELMDTEHDDGCSGWRKHIRESTS